MIGNDVVDLELSRKESNWQRKGFLDKIFTKKEQLLIQKSGNQEIAVWDLWSRKEAVYKIWNRETGIRKYNPIQFECFDLELKIGKVRFELELYFTKTKITNSFIHTIAVSDKADFLNIITLENSVKIQKENGIPFYRDKSIEIYPVSKSQHGRFERIISIKSPI
jgi:phosphopantetheinyl transferase (holo-ACP synthase)